MQKAALDWDPSTNLQTIRVWHLFTYSCPAFDRNSP